MPLDEVTLETLQGEITDAAHRFPALTPDAQFVLWFLRAYLVDDEEIAAKALAGVSNDKGVDAVLLDETGRSVFIVQGKFRKEVGKKLESRTDITSFADLGRVLWGDKTDYKSFCAGLDPLVQAKLDEARERLHRRSYRLHLYYVTLGRCSRDLRDDGASIARQAQGSTQIVILDGRQVLALLSDYLDGVAPPVRSLDLPVEVGGRIKSSGAVSRFDPNSNIESWVFTMSGSDLGGLYEEAGIRLFARNIRGFLGNTRINQAMEDTLSSRPHYFWYFNNGVTIVCDSAQKIQERGREILRVENPQVINGQQTTRVLAGMDQTASRASVLVRVIRVPRGADQSGDGFEELVSRIVEATNWQNFIRASDLVSNDRRQILIEREFRKLGYQYLRKRQTKREARRSAGTQHRFLVKKEELAQAVAASKLDPALVRRGKEALFEEPYYSSLFDSGDPHHYLTRYWLMRSVTYNARGYPERAYAKWVVLHFVWSRLGREIECRAVCFEKACERPNTHVDLLRPLDQSINAAFNASLGFYRANRGGSGPRALDVSTFFQRRDLHRQFAKYWEQPGNRHKAALTKGSERFVRALAGTPERAVGPRRFAISATYD